MANPQVENGFVRIANELFDALARIRIPGESRQVLDVIFRRTYGFNKKQDSISLAQFHIATGLAKPSIIRGINNLTFRNIIYKNVNGSDISYRINKDYSSWKPFTKKLTVYKSANDRLQKSKRNVYKKVNDPIKNKDNIKTYLKTGKKFTPPTLDQVFEYCKERNNRVDPSKWMDHYIANGWMVGKNKMKDWKAAVRTWEHMDKKHTIGKTYCDYDKHLICDLQCPTCPKVKNKKQSEGR